MYKPHAPLRSCLDAIQDFVVFRRWPTRTRRSITMPQSAQVSRIYPKDRQYKSENRRPKMENTTVVSLRDRCMSVNHSTKEREPRKLMAFPGHLSRRSNWSRSFHLERQESERWRSCVPIPGFLRSLHLRLRCSPDSERDDNLIPNIWKLHRLRR